MPQREVVCIGKDRIGLKMRVLVSQHHEPALVQDIQVSILR
jgi:hypothetical protein